MLDIKTLMLLYLITNVLNTGAIALIWIQNKNRYSGMELWFAGILMQVIGPALLIMRGSIPDILSMAVSNTVIQAGSLLILFGLGKFCAKKIGRPHNIVFLFVFFAVLSYFTVIKPNLAGRNVAISLMVIFYSSQSSALLLWGVNRRMRAITRLPGIIFAIYAGFDLARIVLIFTVPDQSGDFFKSGTANAVAITGYIALNFCLTIGLVLMAGRRLLYDMKVQEEKFSTAFQTSPYAISITELESGKFIEVNDAFLSLTGFTQEEVISKTSGELNLWDDMNDRLRVVEALKAGTQIVGKESRFRKKAGGIILGLYSAKPIQLEIGTCLFSSIDDITARRKIEDEVRENESRLKTMVDILQHQSETVQEFLNYSLDQAIRLTESKIGYIYHYDEDRKEFVLNSWSKEVMAECKVANPSTTYSLDKTGVWGEAVRQRRPIIVNDFKSPDPLKKGYPEGHVHLLKFMTVPIFRSSAIVGVVGLANKSSDYGESDILQVSLLMEGVWRVTEKMQADEKIKDLLAEKEIILKEVHHRIKNNMGTIQSILSLQALSLQDAVQGSSAVAALEDAQNRVRSMMILYEKLYCAPSFEEISIKDYLGSLIDEIVGNFPGTPAVRIEKSISDFLLPVGIIQPLGIMINELVTNIMKYAFKGRSEGVVSLNAALEERRVSIMIHDDGNGIPESVSFENSSGFGLMLVGILTKQLNGSIRIERENGTGIFLEFDM